MQLSDIRTYFHTQNRRFLTPEETSVVIAKMLADKAPDGICFSDIREFVTSNGYYNVSAGVLHRTLKFFVEHGLCDTYLLRCQERKGRTGRPKKIYAFPEKREEQLVLEGIAELSQKFQCFFDRSQSQG